MFNLDYMISLVGILLSVAFFTLVERKLMGLMHYRKGPSKVVVQGLSQPMADAIKLLTKETTKMSVVKYTMFFLGPMISITLMMSLWLMYEFSFSVSPMSLKIIMMFTTMSLTIYGMLSMSWGSNNKYAMLGGHRAVAQVMSYEVCMFITVLVVIFYWKSYNMQVILTIQQNMWMLMAALPLGLVWILLCLAESNRTPFDTAEGESEIVSGFNIEYGSGLFAFIFISEYGMIIMLSFMTSFFFLGGSMILTKTLMVMMIYVWARCSFPRVRYDHLMMISWKLLMPFAVSILTLATVV